MNAEFKNFIQNDAIEVHLKNKQDGEILTYETRYLLDYGITFRKSECNYIRKTLSKNLLVQRLIIILTENQQ